MVPSRFVPSALAALTLVVLASASSIAHAGPRLLAIGALNGQSDLSGLTGTLENGLPANILGGVGSGLAYAGGNTFIATPDRGPNATPWNAAIDNTSSYISRFHTLNLSLSANASGALPFAVTAELKSTTLLWSADALSYGKAGAPNTQGLTQGGERHHFTGRSDAFGGGNSQSPLHGRFDPEAVRVSRDGRSVFVSDEYGPYIYQFDRMTGQRIRSFALPADLAVKTLGTTTAAEVKPVNSSGREANKGMEGLAITPDGKSLIGIVQAPLLQDNKNHLRIVKIDIETGATTQYAYQLTGGSGVSEITAINDHEFLVDERDGKGLGDGSSAAVKRIYKIDLRQAKVLPDGSKGDLSSYFVSKASVPTLDLVSVLTKPLHQGGAGLTAAQVPAKIEGLTFGKDVTVNGETLHTLWVANDNDFLPNEAGGNQFFVFGLSDADLNHAYVAQQISAVPEPTTYALMLAGLVGVTFLARRRTRG